MKLHFGHLLGLGALAIAGCAAFFSVYGISQLFAGAFIAVVIMASALEFGKLAMASHLQRNWSKIGILKKIYGVLSVLILVVITSAGIYGFLSNAYQKTADSLSLNEAKVKNVTLKKERYDEELDSYILEKSQLSATVNELSKGLANNVIQYKDAETGEIITTTSSNTRRALEAQLKDAKAQRDKISPKMDVLRDSVTSLELQILDLNINNEAGAELGPLKYIAKLLDVPMDDVINYFILLLVFVFDPLAIALVLATNWVFEQERIKREAASGVVNDVEPIEDIDVTEPIVISPPIIEEVVEYVTEDDIEEIFHQAVIQEPTVISPKEISPEIKKVEPIRNRNTVTSVKPVSEQKKSVNVKDLKNASVRKFTRPIPRRRGDSK